MAIYNTYFSALGLQDSLGVLPNLGVLPGLGRLDDLGEYAFSPTSLFLNGEQGVWYDPSDLTPEKVSWRRNLLTYSQDFENAAWTKSNASILSNLALYSQDFGNAVWTKTNLTVTANAIAAPDGTTTASKVEATTAASTVCQQSNIVINATTATASIYGKIGSGASDANKFIFRNQTTATILASITVNWTTGAITLVSGSATTTSTDVGNGWWRITVTASSGITSGNSVQWYTGFTGDSETAGEFSYLWGAQVVPGSTAQTYTRSLATAAPIQFADPLGGTLADKLVENTASSQHGMWQSATFSAGQTYTLSVYAKSAERSNFAFYPQSVTTAAANFNLSAGTSANGDVTTNLVSHSITAVGDGWYRCTITFVASSSGSGSNWMYLRSTAGSGSAPTYTGDGVSGILVYGAQVEQASTASAYQRITDFSSDFLAAFPTHALYQESTGVTPVTALGQSVGRILDKRLGALTNQGPQLVANGDFSNGTTSWSTTDASFSVDGGELFVVGTGVTGRAQQYSITTTAGRTYRVTFTARSGGGSAPGLFVFNFADSATLFSQSFTNTSTLTYSGFFTATGSEVFIWARAGIGIAVFDNISVREVPGNHAIQATSASRPTLQARSNLLTYSEQFDNAAWTKDGATISANATTAPDGTLTADKIVESATTGLHWLYGSSVLSATTQTCSIYAKANERGRIAFGNASADHYATFNLVNGTVISAGTGTVSGGTITEVGNGWYRCSCIITLTSSATLAVFVMNDSNQRNYAGDGSSGLFLWGIQRELGSTATTYQRVVTATDYADVGLPRNLTFDGVDDSLATAGNVDFATWTVGSRRNLLTVPTMFDASAWSVTQVSVTPNAAVAPDGTTTADKMVELATTSSHSVLQSVTTTAGVVYTYSVYVKKAERNFAQVRYENAGSTQLWAANVNLTDGTYTTATFGSPTSTSVAVTDAGNGWWRVALSVSSNNTTFQCIVFSQAVQGTNSYTGDGTSGVLLWGAQLETGSTATAFQDVGTNKITTLAGVFKQVNRGTMAELSADANANNGAFRLGSGSSVDSDASTYTFWSRGTASVFADSPANFAAPTTNVVTGLGDISGPSAVLRVNGTQVASTTSTQGTGNYGSYLLYIGSRPSSIRLNGRLFQLVIRGAATDSVTVGNAERWVGQLTGVNL